MSRSALLLLIWMPLLFACVNKRKPPIEPHKMEQVLMDLHMAESFSTLFRNDSIQRAKERNTDSLAVFYRSVFKRHGLTLEEFDRGMSWYKEHPEELDSIYARLVPQITAMDAVYHAQAE